MEPKERILERSHELFNKYGIRSVSMDDIAAQLGMSKKTLYQYFSDKEELVDACFSGVLNHSRTQCLADQQQADNPIQEFFLAYDMMQEMFAEMNPSVLYDMEKYHPAAFKKFKEFKYGFLYKVLSDNLQRGIKDELYRPDIDVDVIARLRIESVMLPFNGEVFPNNRTQLIHIEQQLFEHFLFGLATAKGQKLIQKYKNQRIKQ
ncbi:TetR/AcrR family transcriptional regulator [Flavisolibacter ginsenosidimutans]|uniref:TetR/AcrR family transcriptional regulator n=1 Tax=Flavisolibacter ginsenosidimutans TaxID=661481 RepID=A0A5B8UKL3_9BACT|nr:TetR/AcrR family transcriptional regulator [Flavisolibacter ginsenosidimutans]